MPNFTLPEIDRLRDQDAERALSAYAAHSHEALLSDAPRIEWITSRFDRLPPEPWLPLWHAARDRVTGVARRRILNGLGIEAWYNGKPADAEGLWREALREGRESGDVVWMRSLQNVALAFTMSGRFFESLVLSGAAERAARRANDLYASCYARTRRIAVLTQIADLEPAEKILRGVEDDLGALAPRARALMEDNVAECRTHLYVRAENWEAALDAVHRQLDVVKRAPTRVPLVEFGIQSLRMDIEYELDPSRADELMDELERAYRSFGVEEHRRPRTDQMLDRFRFRAAILRGDRDAAESAARRLLDRLPSISKGEILIEGAQNIGTRLDARFARSQVARDAFELAAASATRRIVEIERVHTELPELAEATADDWAVYARYKERAMERRGDLLSAIARQLRTGDPVVALLVDEHETVRVCAWCGLVNLRRGGWVPIGHFLPPSSDFLVSHGMCPTCHAGVAQSVGVPNAARAEDGEPAAKID